MAIYSGFVPLNILIFHSYVFKLPEDTFCKFGRVFEVPAAHWLQGFEVNQRSQAIYPLVNVYMAMENHNVSWNNSLHMAISVAMLVITRKMGSPIMNLAVADDSCTTPLWWFFGGVLTLGLPHDWLMVFQRRWHHQPHEFFFSERNPREWGWVNFLGPIGHTDYPSVMSK